MTSLSKELVFLILQFLEEENYKDAAHRLEKESGYFFNMKYFEDCVTNGEWDEVEMYLSGFTKVEDNRYSMKIFFEIRKQKYLEALDNREHSKAVDILVKDLKGFSTFNEELFKEITLLLTLGNFRENEQLSKYGDAKSARAIMLVELKKLIEANPLFRDKFQFPTFKNSRLRTLINQSLNWQHQLCKNPRPNPEIKTLFIDHACGPPNGACGISSVTSPLIASIPKVGLPLGAHGPFQPTPASLTMPLAGWMANPPSLPHQTVSGPLTLGAPNNADPDHVLKRARPFGLSDGVASPPIMVPMMSKPAYSLDDLPRNVVANLPQGSAVKSMDFHPTQHTLLLVGTNIGDVTIWEVGSRERLAARNFKIWDLCARSMNLQTSLAKEYTASVNRVIWSPDGSLFGIAYSKHVVHVYSYHGGSDLRNHFEIEAHVGNVSDLAFSYPNKQSCIVTCGEDRTIKVWDAVTGNRLHIFEGHGAVVYSVCPYQRENIPFIFSTDVDGKIKAWLYDNMGSRVNYDAPGHSCSRMVYSTDGTRLFSSGTNKEGESYIVEWNESEGAVKRTYQGVGKRSAGIVQLDTTRNRFLAVGDEFQIKFWDMDNVNLLTTSDADGGLSAVPCLRFNKEGMLLAVSTSENGIKILANADGARLLRSIENRLLDASKAASGVLSKGPLIGTIGASSSGVGAGDKGLPTMGVGGQSGDSTVPVDLKPRIGNDLEKSKMLKLTEINEPSQLRSSRLDDNLLPARVIRLIYTNSGSALLALADNAVHKLWKWQRAEQSSSGKILATASVAPTLWQPGSGILMANDVSDAKFEDAVPCFALSKNDSYVLSASGGKISLFNMMSFKTMTTFMRPPPAATYIAFHPQDNNVIAIGMDDASIQIYNIRVDQVKSKLKGHQKRINGLAFSNVLNILASSGSDAQVCIWSMDGWERRASKFLQIPEGRTTSPLAHTHIQFHQDQVHLLAVHETQIAILEAPKLECIKQWVVPQETTQITSAAYACDGRSIYASFQDGNVAIFAASTLQLRCQINAAAYIPSHPSKAHPLVIAAHPTIPSQFAVGLNDGTVHVVEPLESEGKWVTAPSTDKGLESSLSTATASEQKPK